jgi:hypothetical protein
MFEPRHGGRVIVAAPDYLADHGTPETPEDLTGMTVFSCAAPGPYVVPS